MNDSFGDGWNGGEIDIYVNGLLVLNNQFAIGTGTNVNFTACSGESIQFDYTSGSYEAENSFTIEDETGATIGGDGPAITTGLNFIAIANCPETCSDGIMNQDETGIDCGGTFCVPCHCLNGVLDGNETIVDFGGDCGNCNDGIQNGPETGVDCGGPICLPCNTNSTVVNSETCCDATPVATVYPTNCDQIGTSAYNINSPIVNMTSSSISAGCMPSPSPTGCGTVTGTGTWTQVDLTAGIDYVQLAPVPPYGVAPGNHTTYHAYFQGPDCGNLNFIDCQVAMDFSSGNYFIYESSVSGIDPNQNLWIYTWDDGNKAFNQNYQVVGAQSPSNTACPGSTAIGEACNLGSQGATFNTPGSQGVACSGGNWGSNENTTFYSFTADATTGSLEIEDIICNDGTNGAAQFAVWTSCAAIGTYGPSFLGCAVGTASITLSPLVVGQTYYIAADGYAGDNCTWGFTGTGILLPIELGTFTGLHNGRSVVLNWTTISETNNEYFTIQRTLDGVIFEDIGTVSGAGNSQTDIEYEFFDYAPFLGTSYYRLKQTDYDGQYKYSEVISVRYRSNGADLVRTVNILGQDVGPEFTGIVIDIFDDGSSMKRHQ